MWWGLERCESFSFSGQLLGVAQDAKHPDWAAALFALKGGGYVFATGFTQWRTPGPGSGVFVDGKSRPPELRSFAPSALAVVPNRWAFAEVSCGSKSERRQLAQYIDAGGNQLPLKEVKSFTVKGAPLLTLFGRVLFRSHGLREDAFQVPGGSLAELFEITEGSYVGAVGRASEKGFAVFGPDGYLKGGGVIFWRVRVFESPRDFLKWQALPSEWRGPVRVACGMSIL